MQTLSNTELCEHIFSGDKRADAELYRRFAKRVLLMLRQRTKDAGMAEDMVHDTMIIVLEKLRSEQLDDPENLPAYIQQTAKYVHIGQIRLLASRRTEVTDSIPEEALGAITGGVDAVVTKESARHVRKVLAELPQERDRQILLQHYLLERSKSVVCENLELSPAQFDRVLYTARKRLKTLLESSSIGIGRGSLTSDTEAAL